MSLSPFSPLESLVSEQLRVLLGQLNQLSGTQPPLPSNRGLGALITQLRWNAGQFIGQPGCNRVHEDLSGMLAELERVFAKEPIDALRAQQLMQRINTLQSTLSAIQKAQHDMAASAIGNLGR